ncbi:MAG TPA: ATP-binding protein, partial [Clostridiales bacterium]|nr:ATP-binding protein [Clostridiales bacterium]
LFSQNQAEGITAGNHREFFDRFYRGDASRSSEKKGYGIGLSMAQTVVRAHGGTITAQSDDGKTLLILAQLPDGLSGREASKQVAALRKAKMAASDIPYTDVEDTEPEEVKPEDIKTENLKHEKSKPETLALAGPKPEEPRPENGNPED